jgi:hypothetical protein
MDPFDFQSRQRIEMFHIFTATTCPVHVCKGRAIIINDYENGLFNILGNKSRQGGG